MSAAADQGSTVSPELRRERRRRLSLTAWLTFLGVGVLMLVAGSDARRLRAVQPGSLSRSHGGLGDRCELCHEAARSQPLGWLKMAVRPGDGEHNDALCLRCHELGAQAHQPHGIAPESLATVSARAQPADAGGLPGRFQSAVVALTRAADGSASCAGCHQEHRGGDAALAALPERHCHGCHQLKFGGFAIDHPEFREAPAAATIAFSHTDHRLRHHPERGYRFACQDCHRGGLDRVGLVDFARGCGDCHLDQIRGEASAGPRGLPVIRIPGLDLETLRQRGARLPRWPDEADAERSPLTDVLLAGGAYARALDGLDLLALDGVGGSALARVEAYAHDVEMLLTDLAAGGHDVLAERVEAAIGRALEADERAALTAGLPETVVEAAIGRWLQPAERAGAAAAEPAGDGWVTAGGWYLSEYDFTLAYRPSGHADPFLTAWLELTASPANAPEVATAALGAAFAELAAPHAPGMCAKCHRLDTGRPIRWRVADSPAASGLTRFAHAPHLVAPDPSETCGGCHVAAAAGDGDRDFARFRRASCATCHRPERAGADCLLCHDYHIERPSPAGDGAGGSPRRL